MCPQGYDGPVIEPHRALRFLPLPLSRYRRRPNSLLTLGEPSFIYQHDTPMSAAFCDTNQCPATLQQTEGSIIIAVVHLPG